MKITKLAFLLLGIILLTGCSSKYKVIYDSNPRGATLICSGQNFGYTPKTLYYDEEVKEKPMINVSNCSANWISGYTATYPKDLPIFASGGTITTLNRPSYGEGYPQDVDFALRVEQLNAQQSQARAAQQQANQQALQNLNNTLNNSWNQTQMQMQNIQMNNLNNNLNNLNRNLNQLNGGSGWTPQW